MQHNAWGEWCVRRKKARRVKKLRRPLRLDAEANGEACAVKRVDNLRDGGLTTHLNGCVTLFQVSFRPVKLLTNPPPRVNPRKRSKTVNRTASKRLRHGVPVPICFER